MQGPGEHETGRSPNPAIRDLRSEDPGLEPLDELVVLKAGPEREHADLAVQCGQQQHRIPVAEKPAQRAGVARARRERDQRPDQRMRSQDPGPAGDAVTAEGEEDGARRYHDVGAGRDIDRREATPQGLQSHPTSRYQAAARRSPTSRSISACQPVSRVNASLRHVHAGARYSLPLSADSKVARPAICARVPTAQRTPRATNGGTGT